MDKICDYNECTGCNACVQVCPKKAISMKENQYGVPLPTINQSECINCGLCKKVCQACELESISRPYKCYAVWTKNDSDRKYCSSGGLSTGMARNILSEGGMVYGATYKKDRLELIINGTDNLAGIEEMRGSKYVQCNTDNSYSDVKKNLDIGKKVLYVATPCQIMGLRKFLRKDYDNLILVDIICHGVPPFRHLTEHVKSLSKSICEDNITKVTFRGEHDFKFTVYEKEKIVYCVDRYSDTYFTAFLDGLNYRENCYNCKLANEKRGSDITIGDFWGLHRDELKNKYDGRISVALINTSRGEAFFDSIKDDFIYEEREVEEAIQGNGQLQCPTRRHLKRDEFLRTYVENGIESAYKAAGITKKVKMNKIYNLKLLRGIRKAKRIIKKKLY